MLEEQRHHAAHTDEQRRSSYALKRYVCCGYVQEHGHVAVDVSAIEQRPVDGTVLQGARGINQQFKQRDRHNHGCRKHESNNSHPFHSRLYLIP